MRYLNAAQGYSLAPWAVILALSCEASFIIPPHVNLHNVLQMVALAKEPLDLRVETVKATSVQRQPGSMSL